jgi:hypothetical protein
LSPFKKDGASILNRQNVRHGDSKGNDEPKHQHGMCLNVEPALAYRVIEWLEAGGRTHFPVNRFWRFGRQREASGRSVAQSTQRNHHIDAKNYLACILSS